MDFKKLAPKFDRADWLLWTLRRIGDIEKIEWVKLAVICAETVLHVYEEKYPDDKLPRKAIEAAIAYTEDPSEANRKATAAADAAADAAAYAAAAAAADAADAAAEREYQAQIFREIFG